MQGIFFNGSAEENFIGHILAEVYKDKVYEPILKDRKDLTILDIGANVGITSYYFSQFASQVYSMEPSKEHGKAFKKMVEFNKLDNVKLIPKALYMKDGKLKFFHNQNKTMYSLHQAIADPKLGVEEVECVTLETLFKDEKIKHVDFMKLDIEGSEPEVIGHSTFKRVAPKIDTMLMELHTWSGRNPNQIVNTLKMNGFNVQRVENDANLLLATK